MKIYESFNNIELNNILDDAAEHCAKYYSNTNSSYGFNKEEVDAEEAFEYELYDYIKRNKKEIENALRVQDYSINEIFNCIESRVWVLYLDEIEYTYDYDETFDGSFYESKGDDTMKVRKTEGYNNFRDEDIREATDALKSAIYNALADTVFKEPVFAEISEEETEIALEQAFEWVKTKFFEQEERY